MGVKSRSTVHFIFRLPVQDSDFRFKWRAVRKIVALCKMAKSGVLVPDDGNPMDPIPV